MRCASWSKFRRIQMASFRLVRRKVASRSVGPMAFQHSLRFSLWPILEGDLSCWRERLLCQYSVSYLPLVSSKYGAWFPSSCLWSSLALSIWRWGVLHTFTCQKSQMTQPPGSRHREASYARQLSAWPLKVWLIQRWVSLAQYGTTQPGQLSAPFFAIVLFESPEGSPTTKRRIFTLQRIWFKKRSRKYEQ